MSTPSREWPLRRLGEICEFKYGKSLPDAARSGGSIPVYGSNGIVGGHDLPLTASETIVIGRKGSHGEVNFSDVPCWPIDTTYYVDSSATGENLQWFRYRLPAAGLNQMNRAAAVPGLNREDAYRVEILVPPLEEQRRIAAILDQAETLRTQRRAALAQLDSLTQSIFLDMFGDPMANPKLWPFVKLDQLVQTGDTINYGVVQPGDALDEGVPLVRVGDVVHKNFNPDSLKRIDPIIEATYKRSRLRGDEILLTCVGSIGVVALVDSSMTGFNVARAVSRIPVSKKIDRVFLATYLQTEHVHRYFTAELRTVSQPTLNIKQICETKVIQPPLPLQQTFASGIQAVEALKALKATHQASLSYLDALFASLQQLAFAGQL